MKEMKEMKEELRKKLYHPNQITFSPSLQHQTYVCYTKRNRVYPDDDPWHQERRESLDNYGYLRQLNPSPKRNQNKPKPKANNNKLRGKKLVSIKVINLEIIIMTIMIIIIVIRK